MLTVNCLSLFLWILLDEGLVTPLESLSPRSSARTSSDNIIELSGDGVPKLQRVRRGWIWNQFFVLEEYMGSEPQYVGKLHSDLDNGDGSVTYTLLGQGAGSIFTIDEITGDIHAIKSLDREEKSYYVLRAQAVDTETRRPVEPESEFIIKVQDINDNEPRFLDGPYVADVPEMSPAGSFVLQVTATDADDPTYGNSARVVYSILQGQPYFSVDPKTGVIRTALSNMDREVKEEYQVIIQAKDMGGQMGGLAGTTTVNISLTDVNDNPPRFAKNIFHLRVPESTTVASLIGRIKANDADVGKNANIDYSIVPGDGLNVFGITSDKTTQEGIISLKKPLDYENKKSYVFKVDAIDPHPDERFQSMGPFKDTATVKITILDVDEPPIFSKPFYVMDVYEDTNVGSIIGAVTAQDSDVSNSPVRYSIDESTDEERYFTINEVDGTIATNDVLDREDVSQYNISVLARKVNAVTAEVAHPGVYYPDAVYPGVVNGGAVKPGNPDLVSKVPVTIQVLDVNEYAPEFSVPYETMMCENAKTGQIIMTISAEDKDMPPTTPQFHFRLSPEAATNPNFTIHDNGNNTAGILPKRNGYSRRQLELYFLPVVISDSGYPIQSSTNTLTIRVCGCDVDGTILSCNVEAIFLPVGLSTEALIAILLCIIILLVIVVLFVALRRQRKKEICMTSKEDIRDNVISYDDEGGGEEDTQAFDISTLRKPDLIEDVQLRRDVKPETHQPQRQTIIIQNHTDIRDFIDQRLQENDTDPGAPPYDSLVTYAYEGNCSIAESLSSLESVTADTDQDYDYLTNWGPRFKKLADLYSSEKINSQQNITERQ
ncbi:cadherin-12-like isoform X1 [Carcharodon carcharias]|uniref:cadherin-12-like isoform X1 n=1 Tax=Carcharodon carcharias TaxID=13397 RepID=UPI001B7E103A|nr:cadherin-12-like isoform X1 [Carcharodon carcharias]